MENTLLAIKIDTDGVHYRDLNAKLRELVASGVKKIELDNVCGQRYIGTDLKGGVEIIINGTPGNDMGAFLDGPSLYVHGNAQDCLGNTMNEGLLVVHGHAGDICGMAARGGKIFVRDYVGYRAGIHMKDYKEKKSALVVGETGQDFLGEYMAGGVMVVLGLNLNGTPHKANFIGTGMHGGLIYIAGKIEPFQLGKEVAMAALDEADRGTLAGLVNEYAAHFGMDAAELMKRDFVKLYPKYLRPYGRMYAT